MTLLTSGGLLLSASQLLTNGDEEDVRNGAKVYLAATNLSQLSNGGYVWDTTEYDDSTYVTTYGALSGGSHLDAAAVVFAITVDGTYRISGVIRPYWASTPTPAFEGGVRIVSDRASAAGAALTDQGRVSMHYDRTAGPFPTYSPSAFLWEGTLTAATDKLVGIWTGFSTGTDAIFQGSWMSILRIG